MSQINLCRLCVKVCSDYTSLYNETGQQHEIYEIALKYFHPMFLNVDQGPSGFAVLCSQCCYHISDFYNFQQAVLEAQRKLLEGESEIEFESKTCVEVNLDDTANSHFTANQDDSISLPDLELMEEFIVTEDHETDDYTVPPQNANETYNFFLSGEFSDRKLPVINNNSESEQTEDHLIAISESSVSEKDNDSIDNQRRITMKRTRKQRSQLTKLDDVIALWKPCLDCAICKQSLPNFKSLKIHFENVHPTEKSYVECCQRKFYLRCKLEEHARLHLNPTAFKCEICAMCHVSPNALFVHMRLEHKEDTSYIDNKFRSNSSVDCVLCQTRCANFYVLKLHFREKHPNQKCYALCCSRKFDRPNNFEQHMQLHLDPSAFKCEICGKQLTRSDTLQAHMRRLHSNIETSIA